jgi:hypothetical protein
MSLFSKKKGIIVEGDVSILVKAMKALYLFKNRIWASLLKFGDEQGSRTEGAGEGAPS